MPRKSTFLAVVPLLLISCANPRNTFLKPPPTLLAEAIKSPKLLPHQWIKRKVEFSEEERTHLWETKGNPTTRIPFGDLNQEWNNLLRALLPGDELWYWESDHGELGQFSVGYCIIRNTETTFVTNWNMYITNVATE
jgi:hypothetical protein